MAAERQGRPIAQLIREAMEVYQAERLEARKRVEEFPVFAGHRPLAPLPSRSEIYDEVYGEDQDSGR